MRVFFGGWISPPSLSQKVRQAFVFKGYTIIVDYATYRKEGLLYY